MRRRAGWTLLELMVSLGLLTIVGGAAAALTLGAYRDKALSDGYVRDVEILRGAAQTVAKDVRMASEVTASETTLDLRVADGTIRYAVEDGVLLRTVDGVPDTAGRRLARFSVEPVGPSFRIELELAPRTAHAAGRARLSTLATPRCGGGAR